MNWQRVLLGLGILCSSASVWAEDAVRTFEENGILYRETKTTVRRPVYDNRLEPQETTVYREKFNTEMKEAPRSYWQPVTQYQMTPVWERSWNPFQPPYVAYRMVPVTRWELKNDTVRYPYTTRTTEPQKVTTTVARPVVKEAVESVTRVEVVGISPSATGERNQTEVARRGTTDVAPPRFSSDDDGTPSWSRSDNR